MSFTYDLTTDIGKLRIELADTNPSDYIFEDEELQYFIDKAKSNILWAKVFVCEAKAMQDAGMNGLEIEVGDTRIKGGVTVGSNWMTIAKELRDRLESGLDPENAFSPYAYMGGVFTSDRRDNERDIENGIIIEREFYDYYNESGIRGGQVTGNGNGLSDDGDNNTHQ